MILMETERLILRNVKEQDAEIIYDYRNHPLCARYQRGQIRDRDGIFSMVASHKCDTLSVKENAFVAVALKDTDEMVGEIVVMPNCGTVSLGYTFSYRHHRKGYAYESISHLIRLLHEAEPDWDFISFTDPENTASIALLRKLGYRDMGYSPKIDSLIFGKWTTPETEAEIAQATGKNLTE